MFSSKLLCGLPLVLLLATNFPAKQPDDWGFFAHRRINRLAVFSLPPEMGVFFKKHVDWLTEHATDPDVRRYVTAHEAPRHYIDLDNYGQPPFANLPRGYADAMAQFTEIWAVTGAGDTVQVFGNQIFTRDSVDVGNRRPEVFFRWTQPPVAAWRDSTLLRFSARNYRAWVVQQVLPRFYEEEVTLAADSLAAFLKNEGYDLRPKSVFFREKLSEHGILPWHLQKMQRDLTEAFRTKNQRLILRLCADMGHYIGDAHVPLHTVSNYNGQKTGQHGIHAFWESRLPELFADEQWDFFVGKAAYIADPQATFWETVLESNRLADSVLQVENRLRHVFPTDQQICPEMRGARLVLAQCRAFCEAYQRNLNGMVERRMRAAIHLVASAWYTAWVDAGQPDLSNLEDAPVSEAELQEQRRMKMLLSSGKILGRHEEH